MENLDFDDFRFCPILIVNNYETKHRKLVATIEQELINHFLKLQLNIWNTVDHDLLVNGNTILKANKGKKKEK